MNTKRSIFDIVKYKDILLIHLHKDVDAITRDRLNRCLYSSPKSLMSAFDFRSLTHRNEWVHVSPSYTELTLSVLAKFNDMYWGEFDGK